MMQRDGGKASGKTNLQQVGELGVAEGYVGSLVRPSSDDVAEGRQGLVNVLCLLERLPRRTRFVDALTACQVDEAELAARSLPRRLVERREGDLQHHV